MFSLTRKALALRPCFSLRQGRFLRTTRSTTRLSTPPPPQEVKQASGWRHSPVSLSFPPPFRATGARVLSTTTTTTTSSSSNSSNDDKNDDKDCLGPSDSSSLSDSSSSSLFFANADEYPNFASLGLQSSTLLESLERQLPRPSAVQVAVWKEFHSSSQLIVGAETGSGKTLAYLLPLVDEILRDKEKQSKSSERAPYDYARALLLVPNKELAHQVLNMACQYCCGEVVDPYHYYQQEEEEEEENENAPPTVRWGMIPGGLNGPLDYRPFRQGPKLDLCISTPAAVSAWAKSPKHLDFFCQIPTLLLDEADMLLDGGYIRELQQVLTGFRRADRAVRRHYSQTDSADEDIDDDDDDDDFSMATTRETQYVLVAATLPNVGLKSVDAFLQRQFPHAKRVALPGWHQARHSGLRFATEWMPIATNRNRLENLVQRLTSREEARDEKVMVFLNSVADVEGATVALRRAGVHAIPYHAKLSLTERGDNLQQFRNHLATPSDDDDDDKDDSLIVVLVCTDLASRGLDIPNVTMVVQLQFATNVVSHLHRMGRCGRAGRVQGRGLVYYNPDTEKDLVEVVQQAEREGGEEMALAGNEVLDFVDNEDDDDDDDDDKKETPDKQPTRTRGSVQHAFSRRRGFAKKRKKMRREGQRRRRQEEEEEEEEDA